MRTLLFVSLLALTACATLDGNPTPRCSDAGRCAPGLTCDRGFCITADCDGGGLTACGTMCVDTQSSSLHCGDCTTVCPPDTHCDHGLCRH